MRAGSRAAGSSSTTGRRHGFGSCGDLAGCAWKHERQCGEKTGTLLRRIPGERDHVRSCNTLTPPATTLHFATRAWARVELHTQNRVMLLKCELLCQGDSIPKSR